jgi:exopolysaccharide biosynthesis polyprenyl glycosylphosphotransferase
MTAMDERHNPTVAPPTAIRVLEPVAPWQRRYIRLLSVLDIVGVVLAVSLAQWFRFKGPSAFERPHNNLEYSGVSAVLALAWLLALSINHSRSPRVVGSGAEEYRRVWISTISTFGGAAIISMLFKLEIARGYLLIALPVGIVVLLLGRWAARQLLIRLRQQQGRCLTRIVAVGGEYTVRELIRCLDREPWAGYKVTGACITGSAHGSQIEIPGGGSIPVFGDESDVITAVLATRSHAVAVAATERLQSGGIRALSWDLEKLNVGLLVAPGLVDIAGPRLQMRPVAGLPLIHVEKPQYHGAQRLQKRVFDICFASMVLVIGSPILMAIAIAVKLSSKGPVFYRQERLGLDGRPFDVIKFRTMVDGADTMLDALNALNESVGGVLFKIREDPRITPVGRFLRKYSLDEVPQFINVLTGEMSVVGPRPPLATEASTYDDHTRRRLLVRPGITGLWQVSGRSDLSWEDSVRLDLFYVENWSMMADLVIAAKTVRAVLSHRGAY